MIENENKLIKEISSEENEKEFKENIKIINNNLYDKFLYEIIHGVLTGTNIPTREPMSMEQHEWVIFLEEQWVVS